MNPKRLIRPEDKENFHILLVEDNWVSQNMTMALLRREKYQVTCAKHGEEALAILDAGHHFDLILMDCKMPILDGYKTTEAIRQREQSKRDHIPIVALTADASKQNLEACMACGMDDFIAKPLNRHILKWMVDEYVLELCMSNIA